MRKPVSILALDDAAASLAHAVQRRVAAACGLEDLVQARAVGAQLTEAIASIHAQRQAPDSPLRARDDISTRELVLVVVSASGPARSTVLETARQIRQLYDMRRLAQFYSLEILCLMPDLLPSATAEDYGAAYSLLRQASGAEPRPFETFWLLDSTNANRVRFGRLDGSDVYAEAVAGALLFEPELSGVIAGAFTPRGMDATFSSFGYAGLFFPREVALQRLEPRFAAELVRGTLLREGSALHAPLAAKQLVVGEEFAAPLARIGIDAGQSLFTRFRPKTFVTEKTRTAEEVIAAVRNELQVHRDGTHVAILQALAAQGEETRAKLAAQLSRVADETLDRDDYPAAIRLFEALLDPMPDLRADAEVSPRNLVTELRTATAALDQRLQFAPNTAASDAARKRIREVDTLLQDQKLVADVHAPVTAAEQLEAMAQERDELTRRLPELLFAEEGENNAARNAAREAEVARLAEATLAKEQQLRELFAQLPRAELELREALEARRAFLWRQTIQASLGVIAMYAIAFLAGSLPRAHWPVVVGLAVFAVYSLFRYLGTIAPRIRAAREHLARLHEQIETTDKAKNNAHNDELQFEYDMSHRRTTLSVLRRTREAAKAILDGLNARRAELEALAAAFAPASIVSAGVSIAIVEDADVDAWYERTAEDRKPLGREFPVARSASRQLALEDLRARITAYAANGFESFRKLTLAQAATIAPEASVAQRLKRFLEYSAPLIEVREDDLPAQQGMQRDSTLWMDESERSFVELVRRRLPDAHFRPPQDPLRLHALTRVLHYPAYVLGQIDYYRAQYDPARFPESANVPDLIPTELVLTGGLRSAYEQVLLGRAVGVIRLRDDGQLRRASSDLVLGDSHLVAAQRLASSEARGLREELDGEIAQRLVVPEDVERELRELLASVPASASIDRTVIGGLIKRYGSELG